MPKGKTEAERLSKDVHISDSSNETLHTDLNQNQQLFKTIFENCSDIVFHPFRIYGELNAVLVYVDNLIDIKYLEENVLQQIIKIELSLEEDNIARIRTFLTQGNMAGQTKYISDIIQKILTGNVAIVVDGECEALLVSVKGWKNRSIEEPSNEIVIRGPKEGFVENISINMSMLRRRLTTPQLKMESLTIGKISRTDIVIAYVDGRVKPSLLEEVKQRLNHIQIDEIIESGYIEGLIEDTKYTPFPQIQNTERPDVVSSSLLDGKVCILVDNTPVALIVPLTFWTGMSSVDDYYERFPGIVLIRWLRLTLLLIAVFLPSIYVAIMTFHHEMIPAHLIISFATTRESSPFPLLTEALLMEISFEALREAGIRLPKNVGSAVSIVGALVIGQSAVMAGLVSAPMVIVVAITGIASFTIPRFNLGISIRMLRFPMILLGGTLGLYGVMLGVLVLIIHILSLSSFGTPYFTPVAPLRIRGLKDLFSRAPWWKLKSTLDSNSKSRGNR
ncbi:spore germination protein [Paenibacillus wynnii]|uniref:spore germination protein n=1 Tax=Paenibacillus wynnii TaxID=268407 RepID=UPI00069164AF|nr:spore germination protein [Paenibacillus wynnii]